MLRDGKGRRGYDRSRTLLGVTVFRANQERSSPAKLRANADAKQIKSALLNQPPTVRRRTGGCFDPRLRSTLVLLKEYSMKHDETGRCAYPPLLPTSKLHVPLLVRVSDLASHGQDTASIIAPPALAAPQHKDDTHLPGCPYLTAVHLYDP